MQPKPNLDFLRAVAVLLVVIDHTLLALGILKIGRWQSAWLGNFGVFIFFVHTALVLMWSLERKPHTMDFYIRRIFRIYPLAILAITVALLTHAPVQGPVNDFFEYHKPATAAIVSNYFLVQNLTPQPFSVVDVLWSLPLEVEMYVVLPMLFFFSRRERILWPLLILWLLTVQFCLLKFRDPNEVNPATVIPMFLPGIMAYVGFARRRPVLPAWIFPPLLAALLAFAMADPTNRKGWYITLALGLTLPFFQQLRAPWIVRPSHELAKYSYGIYLVHPFALVLGPYLLRGSYGIPLQLAVELVSIAVFSVLAYHLVELPLIRAGKRVAALAEWRFDRVREPDLPS